METKRETAEKINTTAAISNGRNIVQQENKKLKSIRLDKYRKVEEGRKVKISVKSNKVVELKT